MNRRWVLVDGSSYLYRAFHALPPLKNQLGEPTGAIYGVVTMLKKLRKELFPANIIVIFDTPTLNFRHQLYPAYKANRLQMPEELKQQIPALHAIIQAMGFPLLAVPGIEADDVIATLAKQAQQEGFAVSISTNDKDFAQLVDADISLINNMTGAVLNVEGVINRFGVKPSQIVDYLALIGDTSDNVPGVPMVGPKTAVKWLTQYETLEELLAQSSHITGRVGENLRKHQAWVKTAKQLITIQKEADIGLHINDLHETPGDPTVLRQWFERLEFHTWLTEDIKENTPVSTSTFRSYDLIVDQTKFKDWLKAIQEAPLVAVDLETTSLNVLEAKLVGIALAIPDRGQAYIPLQHDALDNPVQLDLEWVLSQLKPWLENKDTKKIGHNLKYDQEVLLNYDIFLKGLYADTLLESYLVDNGYKKRDLDALALEYLRYETISFDSIAGKGKQQLTFNQIPIEKAAPYAAEDVAVCLALHEILEPRLIAQQGIELRDTIEMPLISVLSRMERAGVFVNAKLLSEQSHTLQERLSVLEAQTYALAGQTFNLSSPKQLQVILYEVHRLPVLSKTSTGQPSTSEKVLQLLSVQHELPALILEYRTLSKLKSTYTDALPRQIQSKTGRIHTAYHQAVVATGRLSSSDPNLQNIPIRTEAGRKIRQAFEAPVGYKLISADYSQIELRLMAHLSQDPALLKAFSNRLDVHTATAAELFDVPLEKVSSEQRRQAKAVNFGLIYGISAYGLASQLRRSSEEAQFIIERYFKRYPGVKTYMEDTRRLAHTQGYVETLWKRRLTIPLIHSPNKIHQKAAERAAINAPLQGTAADIIKRAMILVDTALNTQPLEMRMIMQVHDELVFEVKDTVVQQASKLIQEAMQHAAELTVPLEVTVGVGNNWDEAH